MTFDNTKALELVQRGINTEGDAMNAVILAEPLLKLAQALLAGARDASVERRDHIDAAEHAVSTALDELPNLDHWQEAVAIERLTTDGRPNPYADAA